ncbi:ATP-binding cassette domain-containing protein [Mariniluteicoccus endophyticus]
MRPIFRILGFARELWPYYVCIVVASVLTAATGLLTPFIIKAATDEVVAAQTSARPGAVTVVLWLAVALLATDLTNTLVTNWGGYLGDVMAARLRAILSTRYYEKLLALPQRYFDSELTGTITGRLNRSINETTHFLQAASNNFFPMLLTTFSALAVSAFYSPWLAVLLIIIFPLYTWLTALTTKRWQRLEAEKNKQVDLASGRFTEVIGQIRVVKSFVREVAELTVFRDRFDRTISTTQVQSRWWHWMDVARRGALNAIFFGIYAIIFVQTVRGDFTVGVMVLLIQLVAMTRQPVMMMSYLIDTGQKAIAGSKDFFEVMELEVDRTPAPIDEAPAPRPAVGPGEDMIVFDHATFGYEEGHDVISDVTFSVRRGERVALVGESGGGKTTLVNLLLGLYPLKSGRVLVNGHDITATDPGVLRRNIGVVFQDPSLFSGTIRENLAYGRPSASDDEIVEAAEKANAARFIKNFADGYDALIGERGLKLSGGQKQRIAVGRAILKDAPILILDEATSALDTKSERWVQAGLDALMADRTSIIIAHRLSTISSVDRIVTLKDGRVDEIGTPDELARSGGIYAELLQLQASATKADRKRLAAYDMVG